MKVYKLRDKVSGNFYRGSGSFDKKGVIYTSKGHIKSSMIQSWGRKYTPKGLRLELVTYELTEEKIEDYELSNSKEREDSEGIHRVAS